MDGDVRVGRVEHKSGRVSGGGRKLEGGGWREKGAGRRVEGEGWRAARRTTHTQYTAKTPGALVADHLDPSIQWMTSRLYAGPRLMTTSPTVVTSRNKTENTRRAVCRDSAPTACAAPPVGWVPGLGSPPGDTTAPLPVLLDSELGEGEEDEDVASAWLAAKREKRVREASSQGWNSSRTGREPAGMRATHHAPTTGMPRESVQRRGTGRGEGPGTGT
jgi:hypothetical protein